MSNLTKKAIKTVFLQLLEKKPYNQITVRDIVEECGINRNSFYYHFADIAALAEEIVMEQTDKMIAEHPTVDSLEDFLNNVVDLATGNRKLMYHIYNSVRRDMFEKYLWKVCEHCSKMYLNDILTRNNVGETESKMIINYYKCAAFGQIIGWFNDGMKSDIKMQNELICALKKGMTEEMVARCGELKK